MNAEQVSLIIVAVLIGSLCLFNARKALTPNVRSRQWVSAALALGWPALAGGFHRALGVPAQQPDVFRLIGIGHLGLATAGSILLMRAIYLRRLDRGARLINLGAAGVLALLNFSTGGLFLVLSSAPYVPAVAGGPNDAAIVHRIASHGIDVTLPSDAW